MAIKMIGIDLDGTLLNEAHRISQANKLAVQNAIKNDVHVVIATGRNLYQAEYYARCFENTAYVVAANGSVVKSLETNELMYENLISKEALKKLIEALYDLGLRPIFNSHTHTYISGFRNSIVYTFMKRYSETPELDKCENLHSKRSCFKLLDRDIKISKVIFFNWKRKGEKKILQKIESMHQFEVVKTSKYGYEITNTGNNKGNGIKVIADQLGIVSSEIMTIGDSGNDIEMLKFAGLGVAMGNANEHIKTFADVVTSTNAEDGVAKAINQYVLNTKMEV